MANRLISILIILISVSTASAQFQTGDTELSLYGTATYMSADKNYFQPHTITAISFYAGFGRFVSPAFQIGIMPVWNYVRTKTTDYYYYNWEAVEKDRIRIEGTFGITFFLNLNLPAQDDIVPFVTVQYQITDILPGDDMNIFDLSALGLGGGLRFFVVEKASINFNLLYSLPVKDAKYKFKSFSALFGLSIFL